MTVKREEKVVFINEHATVVLVNGATALIEVRRIPKDGSELRDIKFSGLAELEAFLVDCSEVCKAAMKAQEQ